MRRGIPARRRGAGPRIPRADSAACNVENPGFAAPSIPRADSAACNVENPGFAAPSIPRADSAAYGVENPGFAACYLASQARYLPSVRSTRRLSSKHAESDVPVRFASIGPLVMIRPRDISAMWPKPGGISST